MAEEPGAAYDVKPTIGNHFAWIRTQLALQRTLMAAVRTAVSLIGFGFTVAQFFEKLEDSGSLPAKHLGPEAPRNLGLVLIAAGVISLVIFTWQYRRASRYLRSGSIEALAVAGAKPMQSSTYITSFAVMLIGVAAFFSVLLRF